MQGSSAVLLPLTIQRQHNEITQIYNIIYVEKYTKVMTWNSFAPIVTFISNLMITVYIRISNENKWFVEGCERREP